MGRWPAAKAERSERKEWVVCEKKDAGKGEDVLRAADNEQQGEIWGERAGERERGRRGGRLERVAGQGEGEIAQIRM